jgi:hypothetical protein
VVGDNEADEEAAQIIEVVATESVDIVRGIHRATGTANVIILAAK